jgi:hypothetical protein
LEVAEAVVELVAVFVMQMEAWENFAVLFLIFIAMQCGSAVTEITPIAEKRLSFIFYLFPHRATAK